METQDSTAKFKHIFNNLNDGIVVLDFDRFVEANPAATRMFGFQKAEDIIGLQPFSEELSPPVQPSGIESESEAKQLIMDALNGHPRRFIWRHRRQDGSEFDAEVSLSAFESENKHFVLAVLRDISDKQRATRALAESEEKFRTIVANSQAVIFIVDKKSGKFVLSEGKALESINLEPGEAVGKSAFEMYKDYPVVIRCLEEGFLGNVNREEICVEGVCFDTFFSPYRSEDNSIIGTIGMAINITEKVEALNALEKSESKYRSLFDSANVGITTFDREFKVSEMNLYSSGISGYSKEELLGKTIWEFMDILQLEQHSKDQFNQLIEHLKQGGDTHSHAYYQYKIIDKSGKEKFLISTPWVIKDGDQVIGFTSLDREVTDMVKAEAEIKRLNELRQKSIDIIAHQFRTPLNSVSWNLESLLDGDMGEISDELRAFIKVTNEANHEVIRRLEELLVALEIEQGGVYLTKEKANLGDIVQSVYNASKSRAEAKDINFELELPAERLPDIQMDATKIDNVVFHFVSNAINYTEPGGKVQIKLETIDNKQRVEVSDTGIGIPESEQNMVFDEFFRASNANRVLTDSSGLGLAISQSYVELHSGSIGFTSTEGQGSVFWFELPQGFDETMLEQLQG